MPPRITVNPNLAEAPDFTLEVYAIARNAISAQHNITAEEAADRLKEAWTNDNDAKKQAWEQQELADREEATRRAQEEEDQHRNEELQRNDQNETRVEPEKKKPKLNSFVANRPIATAIKLRPSRFALHKLEERDYIELSYFTPEGCAEAATNDHAVADEAFAFSKVNDLVSLRPISAFKASSKVIQDDKLSWREMSMAKINLLQCMEETGWPKDHIIALATFYLNLENHPKRQEPDGDAVLLAYQAQVRREWHIQLKSSTGEPAFDISMINDDLVDKIGVKMWNATKTQLVNRSVLLYFENFGNFNLTFLLFSFATTTTTYHPTPMLCATHHPCYPCSVLPMLCATHMMCPCYPFLLS